MSGATHPGAQNPTSTFQQMPGTFQGQIPTQSMGPSNPMSNNPYGQGQIHPQMPETMPNLPRASSPYHYAPGQQPTVPSSTSNHPGYQYPVPATTNMQYPQGQALPLSGGYPYAYPQGSSQAPAPGSQHYRYPQVQMPGQPPSNVYQLNQGQQPGGPGVNTSSTYQLPQGQVPAHSATTVNSSMPYQLQPSQPAGVTTTQGQMIHQKTNFQAASQPYQPQQSQVPTVSAPSGQMPLQQAYPGTGYSGTTQGNNPSYPTAYTAHQSQGQYPQYNPHYGFMPASTMPSMTTTAYSQTTQPNVPTTAPGSANLHQVSVFILLSNHLSHERHWGPKIRNMFRFQMVDLE